MRDIVDQKFEETAETISLHGLGFLQIKLGGNQCLHVWHPDLPRRHCSEHSGIHNHRFSFSSTVLRGMQINDTFAVYELEHGTMEATHVAYLHEGERLPTGNCPWIPRERLWVGGVSRELVDAGETYHMLHRVFHSTTPGGDGRVATLMTKTYEGPEGARSLCEVGVEPHVGFAREQMADDDMWAIVRNVLGDEPVVGLLRCDGTMSEDGGSGGERIPCDGVRRSDGSVSGGCAEPCSFVMGKAGHGKRI